MKTLIKSTVIGVLAFGLSVASVMANNPAFQQAFQNMIQGGAAGRGVALSSFVSPAQLSNPAFQAQAMAIFNAKVATLDATDVQGAQNAAAEALQAAIGGSVSVAEIQSATAAVFSSYLQSNIDESAATEAASEIINRSTAASFVNTANVCDGTVRELHTTEISMADAGNLSLVKEGLENVRTDWSAAQAAHSGAFLADAGNAAYRFAAQDQSLAVMDGMGVVLTAYQEVVAAGGYDINGDGRISGEEIAADSTRAWELATVYKLPDARAGVPGIQGTGEAVCSSCPGADNLPVNVDVSKLSCKRAA